MTKQEFNERFGSLEVCELFNRTFSVVYFLYRDGVVVYVGQSKNIDTRISVHLKSKKFDSVKIMRVPEPLLDLVEWHWIQRLKPELNSNRAFLGDRLTKVKKTYREMGFHLELTAKEAETAPWFIYERDMRLKEAAMA